MLTEKAYLKEDRLCVLVRDWHEWYMTSKYFASPPTPTMDLIAMCHELGYGMAFSDVRVIHCFIASSYYGVWLRRDEVSNKAGNKCPHGYNHWANCPDCKDRGGPMPEQLKQAYSVCRFLRSELRKARRENRELRSEYGPTFREIWEKQQREKLLAEIIELEKAEVQRRVQIKLDEFWADD